MNILGESMRPNTIYCGDSCELLERWPAGCVDLVFADPPYNIGYVYDAYRDDVPDAQYVAWSKRWMAGCARVLKPDGSMFIAIGDDFAADLRIAGRELGLHLRNWIIWHYTFGQNARSKFGRSHTHILYFTKNPEAFTFNDKLLRYPSARHTEYQDLRADPTGRVPDDVWTDIPRLCGTFKERQGFHGCQLPEALLMRIILAASNPGEIVLDPFVGSGTTVVAARRLGRRYVGIDLSEQYVEKTRARLANVRDESAAKPDGDAWPALHEELLIQIFRETRVALHNLAPNEVAMRVIAGALAARCGHEYTTDQIRARLAGLRNEKRLPRLPNDTPFAARSHRKSEGKRYVRTVLRVRTRKASTRAATPARRPTGS